MIINYIFNPIKKFFLILWAITCDILLAILLFVKDNLRRFARLLEIALPFAMYFIGQYAYKTNGEITVGMELFIPMGVIIIAYYIRSFANKIGKGVTIPIPTERFTTEDEYGEVSIESTRLQELLLYMNDLENWLHRKGYL